MYGWLVRFAQLRLITARLFRRYVDSVLDDDMALLDDGMDCALCSKPIYDVSNCFATTMVGLPKPLSILDDAAAHPECTAGWREKHAFVAAYNNSYGSKVTFVGSDGALHWISEKTSNPFLPDDVFGRLACLLIGILFAFPGVPLTVVLLSKPKKIVEAPVAFEGAVLASLFGCLLLMWAVFTPSWIRLWAERIAGHMAIFLFVLFTPFAIQAMIAIWFGGA